MQSDEGELKKTLKILFVITSFMFAMPAIAAVGDDIFTTNTISNSGMCEISIMGDSSDSTYTTEAVFTPISYPCAAGTYLPADGIECATCPGNSYCAGGTYEYNETTASGINPCPVEYTYNTTTGKSAISQCQRHCDAGTYLQLLPSGYTQLEYIQTTGTQYIDTGVVMNTLVTPTMSLTLQYDNTNTDQQSGVAVKSAYFKVGILKTASTFFCNTNTDDTDVTFGPADTNKHTFVIDTANATCSLDNTSQSITVADFSNVSRSFFIGRVPGSYASISNAKYYHFSITSNGALIRNMVPAKRDSDDVLGMYDLVNDVFYTNAGTGTFTAGNEVVGICLKASAGHYSAGGAVNFGSTLSQTACPNGYPNSVAGASAQNQCYAACTTANVPHSTAAIGNDYYGDGVDTCAPADSNSCDGGYHYVAATENSLAQCGANEITINWDNGNGGADTTTCTYGGTITTPTTAPTKRGHTFIGWRFVVPSND